MAIVDTTEIYTLLKDAFTDTLEQVGIPISYNHYEKFCISRPIDRTTITELSGFILETTTAVDMLDDDFDSWAGIDNLSLVELAGESLQIQTIRRKPSNPIVHLILKKDK